MDQIGRNGFNGRAMHSCGSHLYEYFYQKEINDENMESRCREISTTIVGAMTYALSIGDNNVVLDQFKQLHQVLPEIDVFVYDY